MLGMIGIPGGIEWIVILIVALLIFGKRLPELMKSLGKSLPEFKKGMKEIKETEDDVKKIIHGKKKIISPPWKLKVPFVKNGTFRY